MIVPDDYTKLSEFIESWRRLTHGKSPLEPTNLPVFNTDVPYNASREELPLLGQRVIAMQHPVVGPAGPINWSPEMRRIVEYPFERRIAVIIRVSRDLYSRRHVCLSFEDGEVEQLNTNWNWMVAALAFPKSIEAQLPLVTTLPC